MYRFFNPNSVYTEISPPPSDKNIFDISLSTIDFLLESNKEKVLESKSNPMRKIRAKIRVEPFPNNIFDFRQSIHIANDEQNDIHILSFENHNEMEVIERINSLGEENPRLTSSELNSGDIFHNNRQNFRIICTYNPKRPNCSTRVVTDSCFFTIRIIRKNIRIIRIESDSIG